MFEGKYRLKTITNEDKKRCSFTKTMHRVTSRSQPSQNYMNCTSNCFCTHLILQIWPPASTGCLQTSIVCPKEWYLAPMKKSYRKLRRLIESCVQYTCTFLHAWSHIYAHNIYVHTWIYSCIHTHTHTHTHTHIYIYIRACIYKHIYSPIYVYICIYTHIQMCVCVYIYI